MKDDAFRKFLVLGIIILFVGASVVVPNIKILTNVENIFSARATEILNGPPFEPTDPLPENNSENIGINPTISVNVTDPDDDTMNVSFYNASDDSLIGTDFNVPNGSRAEVQWSNLQYNTDYDWYAIANDSIFENKSDTWTFKTMLQNNPPYKPGDPLPENNSENIGINPTISVNVTDPDDDTMNVSFYNASDDSLIGTDFNVPNGSRAEVQWSNLQYNTAYNWYAVADDGEYNNQSDTWNFNTEAASTVEVSITKPTKGHFYFRDILQFPLIINTIVYGPIEITVNATSDAGIEKVEFYINNRNKPAFTDDEPPYSFEWKPIICGPYKIKVIAYDNDENSDSDEITVLKWRAHPILILAGSLFILKQLKSKQPFRMTFIRGTVLNLKRVRNEYHARAVRLHYTEFTGLHRVSGTIKLRRISFAHGPFIRTYDIGPLGLTTYIFGFVPGGLN